MEMDQELLKKAKAVETPEALLAFAKENGTDLTEESAKAYFDLLHQEAGEVSDEELDNVSGGGCYNDGRLVVTVAHCCTAWICSKCGSELVRLGLAGGCSNCRRDGFCGNCKYCSYEKGLWLCNNPINMKK